MCADSVYFVFTQQPACDSLETENNSDINAALTLFIVFFLLNDPLKYSHI